jgi:hypothetical protein
MTKDEVLQLALKTLEKIANVNAMDYEYQQWARESLEQLNIEKTVWTAEYVAAYQAAQAAAAS